MEHVLTQDNHNIRFEDAQVLARSSNDFLGFSDKPLKYKKIPTQFQQARINYLDASDTEH